MLTAITSNLGYYTSIIDYGLNSLQWDILKDVFVKFN